MAKKVKILHLIKTLNLGGAEANLFNLIQATNPNEFEMHVGYSLGGEFEKRFQESEARLFKFAGGAHKVKSFASALILLRLVRYIFKNKIDIIHTHNFSAHIWGVIAARITGVKIVEHVHDFRYLPRREFERRRGINKQYKYIKLFKNLSDRVVVLTRQNYEFIVTSKLHSSRKVREILNGIPIRDEIKKEIGESARTLRDKLNIEDSNQVVLTACRIAPEKNIDLILRIAPFVLKEIPSAVFIIAGDGPLLEGFKVKCKREELGFIRFVGFYPESNDLLAISDIFLLPSFLELHSIAILEAMHARVPVVISQDVGCHNEFIIDGENGVLLDPFNDNGWAEAIIKLLKDSQFKVRLGQKGYETCISEFRIENEAKKIESIYRELVGK